MEKLQSITIEKNERYLRQISKKVNISDPELHNNIVVLQDYCMQNDVMAMAAIQLGIPKRIVYVKNTNLDIADKVMNGTKEERIELRKKEGYTIISKVGDYEQLKSKKADENER